MRSHDAIAIVSSHHPKGTILQFWGNSRILNAIHNHSANSSANRTITLWFRHNPPDCGGFTPCRSASISIHTILWSFLQAIPDQKIHQQLQNLLTILGCLPQSVWITSRLQVRKGLQVDWKDCLEIGWIAEQQRKTMTTWVNSWTQHQSTSQPFRQMFCGDRGLLHFFANHATMQMDFEAIPESDAIFYNPEERSPHWNSWLEQTPGVVWVVGPMHNGLFG